MAGLLAWAADVVGGHNSGGIEGDEIPLVFTDDQKKYVQELDRKASNLSRTIEDLRLRLPSPDISQRLPHLFAHSLASNAALALQLNAHSATKEQAQLREVTLQEENAAYEKAISNCKNKVEDRMQEAALLQKALREMDEMEKHLREELKSAENVLESTEQGKPIVPEISTSAESDIEAEKSALVQKLENKKKEVSSMEEIVQDLERKWTQIHDNALKQPTPAQREKSLDKQLHSLIEQLAAKQAQAEGLVSEVHMKEMELEGLNGLWKRIETSNVESNSTRNRFGRYYAEKGFGSFGLHVEKLPYSSNSGTYYEKLMLLRSGFVLYIFLLHILVFIKISF